jgi:hypothetical protein
LARQTCGDIPNEQANQRVNELGDEYPSIAATEVTGRDEPDR